MYMLSGKPRRSPNPPHHVTDGTGERIELMGATATVLATLHASPDWPRTSVAYASRTTEPAWAHAALAAISVAPGVTMADVGAVAEIYPGGKRTHLARIAAATGVPYEEMIFFDNVHRNCSDVASLGVLSLWAPEGLTQDAWEQGLAAYARGERGQVVDGGRRATRRGSRRR